MALSIVAQRPVFHKTTLRSTIPVIIRCNAFGGCQFYRLAKEKKAFGVAAVKLIDSLRSGTETTLVNEQQTSTQYKDRYGAGVTNVPISRRQS